MGNENRYHRFRISKGNGKYREITAPDEDLKMEQDTFLREVLYTVMPHNAANGFVPNRSIVTNAEPHTGQNVVLNIDIKDFFGSTKRKAIRNVLSRFYSDKIPASQIEDKVDLVSYRGYLPQGSPASPHIANMALYDFDTWLSKECDDKGLKYTRYADDITVSGNFIPKGFLGEILGKLREYGYAPAPNKIHFTKKHQRQIVTGLVVNKKVQLPRTTRRWFRAVLHSGGTLGLDQMLQKSNKDYDQILGLIGLQALYDKELASKQIKELQSINNQQ
jgi:RNA-directed DNA polymerase